jgi:phage regulator Rha-like protein
MSDITNQKPLPELFSSLTMSSLQIAELCDKRHDHVIRDIDNMFENFDKISGKPANPNLGWLVKSSTYLDRQGKSRKCYELSKQATIDLISGYSFEVRYRINRRLEELEALHKLKKAFLKLMMKL